MTFNKSRLFHQSNPSVLFCGMPTEGTAFHSRPGIQNLTDLDGRLLLGTWSFSTDNQRLILQNLAPIPSETAGRIEFYILTPPTAEKIELRRTNQSRKTGNTVNEYVLIP